MANILKAVTDVFTASVGWMGDIVQAIVDNPLLLVFTVIPLVGLGVGLFNRLRRG